MTTACAVEDHETFGAPALGDLDLRTPIALEVAAFLQLSAGGEPLLNPIFWQLAMLGDFYRGRNELVKPMPSTLDCAAGRSLRNDTRLGGLDWSRPCLTAVETVMDFGDNHRLGFCTDHGNAMEDRMAEVLLPPVVVGLIDENGEKIDCDAGRYLKREGSPEWTTPCQRLPQVLVHVPGHENPYYFCVHHEQLLDEAGFLLNEAQLNQIAEQN